MFKKILFIFGILLCGGMAFAQNFPPKSNTLVTDFTNTLSPDEKQRLENKLVAFDDSSSTQIAVVIIKSVGDYDINEYGQGLGRNWGIGQKGKNNGILVLVAMDDHKMTIQTGYGAEGALPDAIAYQIRTRDMNPRFKAGDYYGGLDVGTDDIIKYTKGEYKADANYNKKEKHQKSSGSPIGFIVIIVIIILVMIFRNRGGGGQIIGSRGGASPFWWFLAGDMLGSSSRGGGGWGGFSGGGGGDSGGGGFGGFGGGDFGGGGSGGSW